MIEAARAPKSRAVGIPNSLCIAFYLHSLAGGGAERMTLQLVLELQRLGHRPMIVVSKREGDLLKELPPGVEVLALNANRTVSALLPLKRFLQDHKVDILISSLGHNNIVAVLARALARVETRVIIRQHNALSVQCRQRGTLAYRLLPMLYREIGRYADAIVAVSKGVADDLSKTARLPADRITVIYNPVVTDETEERASQPVDHDFFSTAGPPVFVSVGRLVPQKDFSTLIDGFATFRKKYDSRLVIIGEGPLRTALEDQCNRLGIRGDVALLGFQPNPLRYMARAAAVVMSSEYEGFGNVLVEALATGTSVISTDCPYGPAEILDFGRFGTLVPVRDARALATAMELVIRNPFPAQSQKERAQEYSVQKIAQKYIELMYRISKPGEDGSP